MDDFMAADAERQQRFRDVWRANEYAALTPAQQAWVQDGHGPMPLRPMSIAESEAKRENGQAGGATGGTQSPGTYDENASPAPAPRTPAAVFQRQLDSLLRTLGNALNPQRVRLPEHIAGTVFPCYVDAADAPYPYAGEQPDGIPVNDAELDDGYQRTSPGVIGAAKQALVMEIDEHGPKLSLVEKDGTPDLHRREQMKMYAKLKRQRTQGF